MRLPEVDEACTLGLAPTTSSIMMLALGDSLAISCMEVKKFTKDNFKMFHPAGKLGLSLLKVGDVMHTDDKIPLVNLFSSLSDSIIEMTRCSFGCVGVTDESNRLIGIFTDGDLRRNLLSINLAKPITEFMAEQPYSLDADSFIVDSLKIFKNKRIPSAFVCDGSKPIGIVHIHDLIQRGLL